MSTQSLVPLQLLEENINWSTDNLNGKDLAAAVEVIHLCALRNELNEGDEDGEPPTNHWTMCLQLSSTSCLMLDMAPGYGSDGLRGKIELTSLDDVPFTKETLRPFSYKPARNFTVAEVALMISRKGRDEFNVSPEWEGCRYWMSVVMRDLEDDGLVGRGSGASAQEVLLQYWVNPEGSQPRVMREGVFRTK